MKKTVLYIAAVLAVSGGLMWQKPMVAHAEPEVIQEAPVSTVLEVAAEEVADEDNGPAPEIQAAKKLEEELEEAINATGRGPMGLGGDVSCLAVHIECANTHITQNPVAVNTQCWPARRARAVITPSGNVAYGY